MTCLFLEASFAAHVRCVDKSSILGGTGKSVILHLSAGKIKYMDSLDLERTCRDKITWSHKRKTLQESVTGSIHAH